MAGALSDHYGRRRVFALGLAGFGAASLLCGLAPGMEALIAFRVLQGAAGALLVPGSLALIRSNFEGEGQARAYGTWAGATSLLTLLGPLLGGVLVDTVGWRSIFLVNVPLVAVTLWLVLARVPESRQPSGGGFDWLGALLAGLAVGGLSFGIVDSQQHGWGPAGLGLLGLGAGATAALPFWLRRAPHPLVPLELFRLRNLNVVNLSTLLIYGALYVNFYYLPLYVQGVLGYTAAASGLVGLPSDVLLSLGSGRVGRLAGRYGVRPFMVAGPLLMAAGALYLTRIGRASGRWSLQLSDPRSYLPPAGYARDLLPGLLLYGIGIMLLVAPLTTALMGSVPARSSGVASAVNNALSRVGPQLAGALIFAGVAAVFGGRSPDFSAAQAGAATAAFHVAMAACAALLLAGALVNAFGLRSG